MMDASFLQELSKQTGAKTFEIDGRQYSDKELTPVFEPMPEALALHSLTGVVDYVKSHGDTGLLVQVASPRSVLVHGPLSAKTNQRPCYAIAGYCSPIPEGFFGAFRSSEEFTITLQSLFEPSEDLTKVLGISGNLEAEAVVTMSDDGVTQRAAVRAGIARKAELFVQNPVVLAPFRTFGEVAQPASPFILRLRGGGEQKPPACALFPADGGKWELEAIQSIRAWLTERLPGVVVIA